jgi:hypothetical protein
MDSGGLAVIFTGLELAGLLYLARFAVEKPGNNSSQFERPMSIHRHGLGLASSSTYQQKPPLISLPPVSRR